MASESSGHGSFREFEHSGWSVASIVERYEVGFGELTRQAVPALLDAARVGEGVELLDVATGPGYAAAAASQRGARVTAVDFSSAMVETARRRFSEVDFRVGDAESLEFGDGSFDAVTINFGMLHFARPEAALQEAYRVLRAGGWVAFTVWTEPKRAVALGLILDALRAHGDLDVSLPHGTPFFRFSDHEECVKVLGDAGFAEAATDEVEQTWSFRSFEALLDALEEGTVRNRAVLKAQSPEQLAAVREAFRVSVEPYRDGEGWLRLPMPAVLARGRKAG